MDMVDNLHACEDIIVIHTACPRSLRASLPSPMMYLLLMLVRESSGVQGLLEVMYMNSKTKQVH